MPYTYFMDNRSSNLFKNIPPALKGEVIDVLLEGKGIRVERIISMGQSSPPGFWYDQNENEFVILLKGSAGLIFEGSDRIMILNEGDFINIPAHRRHRVEWTARNKQTVWLGIFYD
jgi:cupin 2 domain-containing protein